MTALDILHAHTTHPSSHTRDTESTVLEALNIDVDEGRYVKYSDAAVLALTLWAMAERIARWEANGVLAEDVPAVELRDVLAERAA